MEVTPCLQETYPHSTHPLKCSDDNGPNKYYMEISPGRLDQGLEAGYYKGKV